MKKVLLALGVGFLALVMACGDKGDAQSTNLATGSATGNSQESSKSKATQEPVKVTIYLPGSTQPDQAAVNQALKEYASPLIGAYPEITFIGWGEWGDKKNLMMTSGEEFDIAFTSSWNYFEQEISRNAWLPLGELIDEHAPTLRDTVGDWLNSAMKDGKIYAIPTVKEGADGYAYHWNKKYVDKYNIPIQDLDTPEALEPWVQLVMENEPDVVGFLASGHNFPRIYLGNGDKIVGEEYFNIDGKVTHKWLTDEFWDKVAIQHEWYKKGYFEYNLDDISENHVYQFLESGNWLIYPHVSHPGKAGETAATYGYPVVTGAFAHQQMVTREIRKGSMLSISRTSKHPEAAIKVLELMNNDPVFNNMANFGIEGTHFEFVDKDKGIIRFISSAYRPNMQWALQNQFLNYLQEIEDPDKWEKYEAYNKNAGSYDTLEFYADYSSIKTQVATVESVYQTYAELVFRGILDPAEYKDKIIQELETAGVHTVEAELQQQLDAYFASK